jgi:hypothetical protein
MHDTDCPPFSEVVLYLSGFIISVAMIGYILAGVNPGNGDYVSLPAISFLIVFLVVTGYCCAKLILLLLPERKKICPACSLLAKVLEID